MSRGNEIGIETTRTIYPLAIICKFAPSGKRHDRNNSRSVAESGLDNFLAAAAGFDRANFWLMQLLEIPSAFSMPSARVLALSCNLFNLFLSAQTADETAWWYFICLKYSSVYSCNYSLPTFDVSLEILRGTNWKNIFADRLAKLLV